MNEYRVHHRTPNALIVSIPSGGYGRLTVESAGGDALAERIVASYGPQDAVLCGPTPREDADGYTVMSAQLPQLCDDLHTFANRTTADQLVVLFRQHVLCGLGRSARARVVTRKANGAVLKLGNGVQAVALGAIPEEAAPRTVDVDDDAAAAGEAGDEASATAFVPARVLLYQDAAKIAMCSVDTAVAGRAHAAPSDLLEALAQVAPGADVTARVLLIGTVAAANGRAQKVAVAEVAPPAAFAGHEAAHASVLVYIFAEGDQALPVVGSDAAVRLTFVPSAAMRVATPFCLGRVVPSDAASTAPAGAPSWRRTAVPASEGLRVLMPWHQRPTDDSDSDDDNGDAQPRLRRRRVEEEIDRLERAGERAPTSADDFERMLLGQPTSSYLWTQYMAFHVGLREIDTARTVAEKALKRIPVTQPKELLNIWVALLNLENMHGTGESLTSVFRRALQHNDDKLVVHEKLADIFGATGKKQQLVELCRTMTSKFRRDPRTWERLGRALVDTGKRDQLKRTLKDMAQALTKQQQGPVVVHLAIHEYKHASPEHGRALFEGLVAKSAKRSDVWSAYVDQELGLLNRGAAESSVTGVRNIFERIATMSFAPKVMQAFLTRWMAYEQAHGTATTVQHVKDKAREYVAARSAAVTGSEVV